MYMDPTNTAASGHKAHSSVLGCITDTEYGYVYGADAPRVYI